MLLRTVADSYTGAGFCSELWAVAVAGACAAVLDAPGAAACGSIPAANTNIMMQLNKVFL
jgi:hypothetical protein